MSQNNIIQLRNLSKSYQQRVVVDDLDLDIRDGEFLTLLGPSGCGKTTVLRMISGLELNDGGTILLDNLDLNNIPADKRQVNTVFQSYALFPHMTVYDNVAFGLKMQKVAKAEINQRVLEVLKIVQLEQLSSRMPHELSGGQQQRVAIARAVVNRPKVLLLDESLSALDYKLRKQMQNELKKLQRTLGITFVFVTHDQEEALSMSDRIAVMNNGKIEQLGTPREIYEEPRSLFVARFIGEINIFDATLGERVDDKRINAQIEGSQCIIDDDGSFNAGDRVHVLLRPEDLRIEEIKNGEVSKGLRGKVIERNYKGMTLDSSIRLSSGLEITASEFFDEDDPDFDHSLGQAVAITWVPSWEVVLPNEST